MTLVFALMLAAAPTPPVTLPCPAPSHYDGDDIRCASDEWRAIAGKGGMRLARINAPEIRCRKAKQGHRPAPCQKAAAIASRDHLRGLTAGRAVSCSWSGERTSERTGSRPVVFCEAAGSGDLSCRQWRDGEARYIPQFDPEKRFATACRR